MALSNSPCPILILDGGLGTSLEDKYGLKFASQFTPLWSSHLLVADPETLQRCQSDFGRAGAEVILTATYQTSIHGFARTRTAAQPDGIPKAEIQEYLTCAVGIARTAGAAGGRSSMVALGLGPYGATMTPSTEYSGVYDAEHDTVDKLVAWHRERLALFKEPEDLTGSVDFVAFESIPRIDEIRAVRQLGVGKRFWISVVFPNGETMPDGTTVGSAVKAMIEPQAGFENPWAIGINCTNIKYIGHLVAYFESAVGALVVNGIVKDWPSLVLYPDGANGGAYDTVTQTWRLPDTPMEVPWEKQLADIVLYARNRGNWKTILAGGCCKTSDLDIHKLRKLIPESAGTGFQVSS